LVLAKWLPLLHVCAFLHIPLYNLDFSDSCNTKLVSYQALIDLRSFSVRDHPLLTLPNIFQDL
jgi:hypothetical protein